MSRRHPTEKERARQEQHLTTLSDKANTADSKEAPDDDESVISMTDLLDVNKAYSRTTLMRAMGIGRTYFDSLMEAGMPHRKIGTRFWFTGRKVMQFLEGDDGKQTG